MSLTLSARSCVLRMTSAVAFFWEVLLWVSKQSLRSIPIELDLWKLKMKSIYALQQNRAQSRFLCLLKKFSSLPKKKENNCAGFISYLVYKNLCKTQSYKWKLITLHRLQRRKKHSFNEKWSPLLLEVKAPWLYN